MAGQQVIAAVVYTLTFVLCVLLNVILIPRFGLVGAASAMSLALIAETIALYVIMGTRLGIRCSIFTIFAPRRPAPEQMA
jgi:O-antigen/teichoic acid export membrane protein